VFFTAGVIMNSINMETERLILQPLVLADAPSLFAYRSLDEVKRFQTFNPSELVDAVTFIKSISVALDIPDSWYQLGIFLKDSKKLIGDIGVHFLITPDETELGCTIASQYWGQGYVTEGLTATIFFLFNTLKKKRIYAFIDTNNLRSRRLFERLGFLSVSQTNSEITYQLTKAPLI
jgi:RimJ/RimL family protein N-acetyltransferase